MGIISAAKSIIRKCAQYGVSIAGGNSGTNLKFIPKSGLDIAVHMTTHCNLNCQNCDTYSTIAEKSEQDLDELEADIKYLSELMTPDRIHSLHLSGGEPLMHSRIEEIPSIVRKYLPRTYIYFISNGLLLPKLSDRFYTECRKNFINIEITRYPVKFDYDKVFEYVQSKGVQIVNYNKNKAIKTSWHFPINFDGSGNSVQNFARCGRANYCHVLFNHRLYTCSAIPRIRIFNERFNTNVPISDFDGIDIYKAKNGDDILQFLAKPVPFCRFCDHDKYTFEHEWKTTQHSISEYYCGDPEKLKNKLFSAEVKFTK
jgi:hypothetical protein